VPEIQRIITQRIREGHTITLCVDASEFGGYDTDFRRGWASWFGEHKGRYHPVPILCRSAFVRMGITS
jgi:hypothetical protein